MAAFTEHCDDCERLIGNRCEDVNGWMDEYHRSAMGPLHRFMRHHSRGVQEAAELFGDRGRLAATIHILKDCGRIPTARQWRDQEVDSLGYTPGHAFIGYWEADKFDRAARRLIQGGA